MTKEEAGEQIGSFEVSLKLELREDGTYIAYADGEVVKDKIISVLQSLKPQLRDMLIRGIGEGLNEAGLPGDFSTQESIEAALGSSLDDLLKISSGYTMDELLDKVIEEARDNLDIEQYFHPSEGNYTLDLDKGELCFSLQLNDEPDPANVELFRLEDGKLVFYDCRGESVIKGEYIVDYPIAFTREP